ncbi:MAG TPA: GNAT family protein [Pyrinomonadaceae bacterium]|jgi:RimJ/RimL family protein N-acetyltransferase|nr:GNAT family protein [Pyrinomonadaceae bacterium]
MNVVPVTLEGRYVRLEPLTLAHLDALCVYGLDPDLWRFTTTQIHTREEMRDYVEAALEEQARGSALPFATVERAGGEVVGSTRFGNIEREHRGAEIGWTWVARPRQRTPVNTEAKYLMLGHAFATWNCLRVALKTDSLNERSRRAILRVGAKEEGTLRNHMITSTGRVRHTTYFSIIDSEWQAVKAALEAKLSTAPAGEARTPPA